MLNKKKYIIIYSNCLRSKIILEGFIYRYREQIQSIIQIPIFYKKKSFIKDLLLSCYQFKIFQFFNYVLFEVLSPLLNTPYKIAKALNINFYKLKKNIDLKQLEQIHKFSKKNIILYLSNFKIKKCVLNSKYLILNFHEAPLPKYAGSALYFHLKIEKKHKFNTSVIIPNEIIDSGKVILKSKSYPIKKLSVFSVALTGYLLNSKLICRLNKLNICKFNKLNININKNKNKIIHYKIPNSSDVCNLKNIFTIKDIIKILFLYFKNTKNIDEKIF